MKKVLFKYLSNLSLAILLPLIGFGIGVFLMFSSFYVVPGLFIILLSFMSVLIYLNSKDSEKFFSKEYMYIDNIKNKISNLQREIELIPNDELLKDIKDIKLKTLENLKQQLIDMKKAYISKAFPNIYVVVPDDALSFISNDIKEAYKIISSKRFNSDKIEIITKDKLMEKINEKLFDIIDDSDIEKITPIIKILTDMEISSKYSSLLDVKKLSSDKES
jgi:hypothetical protein